MISFIIPAYNEEALLGLTLSALNGAAWRLGQPFEIIVVDDASTDRTAAIAKEHGVRVIAVQNRQIAATRNAGARAAQGDLLVFVDADTVVGDTVIRAAIKAVRRGAVGGGCAVRFDGRVPLYGHILIRFLVPLYNALGLATGCFLFCTAEAFHKVGGFDEGLFGGEETVMSRRLGRRGRFVILRETVITSGRKVRAYSACEILGLFVRLLLAGPKSVRRREGLEVWYGERRPDPLLP
jgi:glycosyltransferase involved in cell wall biosynthesis